MSAPQEVGGLIAQEQKPTITRTRLAAGSFLLFAATVAVVVLAPMGPDPSKVALNWDDVPDTYILNENNTVRGFVDTYFQGQAPTQADICNLCMLRRCGVASDGTLASCAKDYKYTFPQSLEAKRCMCGCCSVQCLAPAGCEALSKSFNLTTY